MAGAYKRVAVSLTEEDYRLLSRYSSIRAIPKSQILSELFTESREAIEKICDVLTMVKSQKGSFSKEFVELLQNAEVEFGNMEKGALNQLDLLSRSSHSSAEHDDGENAK